MMIPKIIHYCWLSDDPIPDELKKCMKSWKVKLPDYKFMLWNFDRFPKEKSQWVKEAFIAKKYAFAADYIRLYALYNYGGIYMDMDVEVLKSFNPLLKLNTMLCHENSNDGRLEVATFGVEKHSPWVKKCLEYYNNRSFVKSDGTYDMVVLPLIVRDSILQAGFKLNDVNSVNEAFRQQDKCVPVLPFSYFSPLQYGTQILQLTDNSYSIHHFASSWKPWYCRLEMKLCKFLHIRYRDFLFRHL